MGAVEKIANQMMRIAIAVGCIAVMIIAIDVAISIVSKWIAGGLSFGRR